MTEPLIEKARELKAQGWSLRKIAGELGMPLTQLFRKLQGSNDEAESAARDASDEASSLDMPAPNPTDLLPGETGGSDRIAARIAETRAQLATIEAELAEIPPLKERALAAATLDLDAIADLEARETQLAKDTANLRQRLVLLAQQQEIEEGKEAQLRLPAIVAEAERLIEQEPPALAAYEAALTVLVERAQAVADLHAKRRELGAEEVFLVDRYRLPRLRVPQLGEIPNTVEGMRTINGVFSAALSPHYGQNPWERKRQQWAEQRRNRPVVPRSEGMSAQQ